MIRCRILGPISLSGVDAKPLDDVVTQPRRLALLAYLVMHAPRGFIRRDALFPLFWPDMDQDRARGALRQALYVLRGALGDGVVISRGADEVAVAADQAWCDALEFERACDEARWADAMELYRGDFLQSFFISDAPQFEHWMQEQQGRLRLRATAAARSLAAAQESGGAFKDATATLRRALVLDASDEASLRHLITLLDRQGDRAGAVKEHESFVARLSEEFGVPPSAETNAVFERVRDRDAARHDAIPPAANGALAQSRDAVSVKARAPGPRVWAVAALALLATALVVQGVWSRSAPTDAPERVAVLPFEVSAGAEYGYLREALVDLLSTSLDGAGGMQTIDPNAIRAFDTATVKLAAGGRAAAKRLGARYFILGRAVIAGGKLRVHTALYDQQSTGEPVVEATREGSSDQLFGIVDALAADLLVSSQRKPDVRMSKSAAMTTQSLAALKAYLEGEQLFQHGDARQALDAMRRAVAIDSTFALANYRVSILVDQLNGPWTEVMASGERALRHASRLSERDRRLLSAHMASVVQDFGSAEQQYRAIVARYPDELEGWYRFAEMFFHQNPVTGRSIVDAREPFERLLTLDPANRAALTHLIRIAAVERRTGEIDSLYRRIVEVGLSPGAIMEARAIWAHINGSPAEREKFYADFAAAPSSEAVGSWVVNAFVMDLPATKRMMGLREGRSKAPSTRRGYHNTIARVFAAQGQMDSASAELRFVGEIDPDYALERAAFYALAPWRTPSENALRSWRVRIAEWDPPRTEVSMVTNNSVDGPFRRHMRFFLLGYIDGLLHDTAAVRADADSLERLAKPAMPDAALFVEEMSASIRAHSLWREGKATAAQPLIDKAPLARPYHYRNSYMRLQDTYMRAEVFFSNERYADALRGYGSYDNIALASTVYAIPAHLRRGQIHEQLGNPGLAAKHYRTFVDMWRGADPEFRPMTSLAEARLQSLGAR